PVADPVVDPAVPVHAPPVAAPVLAGLHPRRPSTSASRRAAAGPSAPDPPAIASARRGSGAPAALVGSDPPVADPSPPRLLRHRSAAPSPPIRLSAAPSSSRPSWTLCAASSPLLRLAPLLLFRPVRPPVVARP